MYSATQTIWRGLHCAPKSFKCIKTVTFNNRYLQKSRNYNIGIGLLKRDVISLECNKSVKVRNIRFASNYNSDLVIRERILVIVSLYTRICAEILIVNISM